jgi:hypothetical protein
MNKISNLNIFIILITAILIRVMSIYFFGDSKIDNEWGIMLNNLENYKILSIRSVEGVPVPNLFMPPLYPMFLYSIKLAIKNYDFFINTVLTIQLILSLVSIIFIFKILLQIFAKKLSLIGTLIYAFFPLNIYAASQTSSVVLQMFLINIFIYSFIRIFKKNKLKNYILFSLASALLILLRGEFLVFVLITLLYLFLKNKILVKIFFSIILIFLIISPYLYRNYEIFNKITITKSLGFNLLKGNNPNSSVEGFPLFNQEVKIAPEIKDEILTLKNQIPLHQYDLLIDKIFFKQAIKFIIDDPFNYLFLYGKKFMSFLLIDLNSTYNNYYSAFHIIPKLLIGIFTLIGIIFCSNLKLNIINYLSLFYISNVALFSIFFILPRYSLFLLPIQIILSLEGFKYLRRKFIN